MSSSRRSVLTIAAAAANALLGALLLAIGVAAIAALIVASVQAGGESWESLGTRASAGLGADVAGILELFGVSLSTLFAEFAVAQGLPAFPIFAREILAALFVGIALFVPTGLAALVAARAVWSLAASSARGALRLYAITLTTVGSIGLFIASAPHLIWGLTLAAGLLNLLALRRPRAVTPPYSA
jgi:hypothetical protein